jgi:hypothetical protein
VPADADHVTDVLLEPVTAAVNCCEAPGTRDREAGLMVTATVCGAATVTVAVADFVGSATLVAFR